MRHLARMPSFILSAVVIALMAALALFPDFFAGLFGNGDPRVCQLADSAIGPRDGHPFGFDTQGCDIYANVIHGARSSISIGLLVTGISFVIAVLLGSVSGFYGRAIDAVISRVSDVFFGFPFLLGTLVILSSIPTRNVVTVSLVLALFSWPTLTRLMRASTMATKEMDYVSAARSLGASDWRILRKHVVPNSISPIIVLTTITVGTVIAAEAVLTFLGIGLQPPSVSWGLQLANAQSNFQQHPHLLLFPASFLTATVLAFIIAGDALADAFDPRRR